MQFENKVLSKEILFLLYESGKTLATAESCTSGKVAESITLMPGASAYFTGGIVAYSEEVKKSLLNVPEELIEELSSYLASSGKRYKSHYATLINWRKRKATESRPQSHGFKTAADRDREEIKKIADYYAKRREDNGKEAV